MGDKTEVGKVLFSSGANPAPDGSQSANPEGTDGNTNQGTDQNKDRTITAGELEAILKESNSKLYQSVQSLTDKAITSVNSRAAEKLEPVTAGLVALQEMGVVLTPDQQALVDSGKAKIVTDALTNPKKPGDNSQQAGSGDQGNGQEQDAEAVEVNKTVENLMKSFGVESIEATDEGYAELVKANNDKDSKAFIAAATKIVIAKSAKGGDSSSRISNNIGQGTSTANVEQLTAELIELQKNPSANKSRRREISKLLEEASG